MKTVNRDKIFKYLVRWAVAMAIFFQTTATQGVEFMVYDVSHAVDLGDSTESIHKNFYINMGSKHGLKAGSTLQVLRKVSTFDYRDQSFYKDLTYPIATLKVIHVESQACIARLDKLLPLEHAPISSPRAVMLGDLVELQQN